MVNSDHPSSSNDPLDSLGDLLADLSPVHERITALAKDGSVATDELLMYLRFLERTFVQAKKRPGITDRERGICTGGARACQIIRDAMLGGSSR